jgi:hypothetical protein
MQQTIVLEDCCVKTSVKRMERGRRQHVSASEQAISRHLPVGNKICSIVTTVESSNDIALEYMPNILY